MNLLDIFWVYCHLALNAFWNAHENFKEKCRKFCAEFSYTYFHGIYDLGSLFYTFSIDIEIFFF